MLHVSTVDSFHIPGIVSLPHFFMADPRVQRSVGGLNPNQQEHETTVDVEPVSYYYCNDNCFVNYPFTMNEMALMAAQLNMPVSYYYCNNNCFVNFRLTINVTLKWLSSLPNLIPVSYYDCNDNCFVKFPHKTNETLKWHSLLPN